MHKIETIYCPNCGRNAQRLYLVQHEIIQTQCPACDYFLSSCARTGAVLETYVAGMAVRPR
ncbi:MAG: replication restart DNA helicase PriA [Spirulina sp. SIO3F2]|nr:replication restart DNA helicase PriA [Spirulina sp. SIO3F2]